MIRSTLLVLTFVAAMAASAIAGAPRQITWDSLVPPAPPLENPFDELTGEQRYDMAILMYLRDLQDAAPASAAQQVGEIRELASKLSSEGVEVENLLKRQFAFEEEIMRRGELFVDELQGKTVRLAGYALPLEYSDIGVTEFLLVPYIGACIHVPPPPANQIVFVRLNQTFGAEDLYTPVWVTGRINVERQEMDLSLVDGEAGVAVGYTLDDVRVELYYE